MSSSYLGRGGMVGSNHPGDSELRRQFWNNGENTEDGKARKARQLNEDLGEYLGLHAQAASRGWLHFTQEPEAETLEREAA